MFSEGENYVISSACSPGGGRQAQGETVSARRACLVSDNFSCVSLALQTFARGTVVRCPSYWPPLYTSVPSPQHHTPSIA